MLDGCSRWDEDAKSDWGVNSIRLISQRSDQEVLSWPALLLLLLFLLLLLTPSQLSTHDCEAGVQIQPVDGTTAMRSSR